VHGPALPSFHTRLSARCRTIVKPSRSSPRNKAAHRRAPLASSAFGRSFGKIAMVLNAINFEVDFDKVRSGNRPIEDFND
jgi:hypothetical protein